MRVRDRLAARDSPASEDTYRTHSCERGIHHSSLYVIMGMGGTGVLHAPFGARRPAGDGWADGGERVCTSDGCGFSFGIYRGHPRTMAPSRDAIPPTAGSLAGSSPASGALPASSCNQPLQAFRPAAESSHRSLTIYMKGPRSRYESGRGQTHATVCRTAIPEHRRRESGLPWAVAAPGVQIVPSGKEYDWSVCLGGPGGASGGS